MGKISRDTIRSTVYDCVVLFDLIWGTWRHPFELHTKALMRIGATRRKQHPWLAVDLLEGVVEYGEEIELYLEGPMR